eukprot:TRINITY_DN17813_c0_g1_i1.p1 TRINITY_DN17813_c0_g1~~TRINITY_DN17813_c0_g1_i1.p1  ORF type:complete len:201 (-),score=35.63 TRINITY_DN17813_c0_g1_i1:17-580(-)
MDTILKDNNVSYFLDGGSLLGAIRHNGWIPWDNQNDIDVGVLHWENDKISQLKTVFRKSCGYMIDRKDVADFPDISAFVIRRAAFRLFKNWFTPFYVDFTDYEQYQIQDSSSSDLLVVTDKEYPDRDYFLRFDKIFPASKCEFEGHTFNCPKDPEYVLEREYGRDWKTPKKDFTADNVEMDYKVTGW